MWSFRNVFDRDLANQIFGLIIDPSIAKIYNSNMKSPKQGDQSFLTHYVYKLILKSYVSHDSYFCKGYERGKPFPEKRQGDCFVGNPYSCDPLNGIFSKCPIECRPFNHQDWEYC